MSYDLIDHLFQYPKNKELDDLKTLLSRKRDLLHYLPVCGIEERFLFNNKVEEVVVDFNTIRLPNACIVICS